MDIQTQLKVDSLTDSPQKVDVREAIRERWRLHPLAKLPEIVAMLELDGVQVPPEVVEEMRNEAQGVSDGASTGVASPQKPR